jgi:DNA polymerase-3 subunit alpha
LWHNDALLLVKGKVELRDGKIQVLCDSAEEYQIPTEDGRPTTDVTSPSPVNGQPSAVQFAMPDETEAAIAEIDPFAEDAFVPESEVKSQRSAVSDQSSAGNGQRSAVSGQNGGNGGAPVAKSNGGNGGYAPKIEPARATESPARYQAARHLRIFLARSNDYDEDLRRMRELLSLLASADGRDRFTFYVPNPQGVVQLDFPNHSTSYTQVQVPLDELMSEWGTLEVQ